jgi:ribosomal-protein-alanine N-acetyltransferase
MDETAFVNRARKSLPFHEKWIKVPTDAEAFRTYLTKFDDDSDYCYAICDWDTDSPVGFVSLVAIEREPYHRGRLGYGVFDDHTRRGYASAGLEHVIRLAFESHESRGHELHRLEADIQPDNHASRQLIEKMGFSCEGISPQFIRINGQWCDHERWALTVDKWRSQHP